MSFKQDNIFLLFLALRRRLTAVLQNARYKELSRLIRTAHQRSTGRVQKSQLIAAQLPLLELGRSHIFNHLQMPVRRLHVLAQR